MKPKELLAKLEKEMLKAPADTKEIHTAVYTGAKMMRETYLEDGRRRAARLKKKDPEYYTKWREQNREEYNEYQRQYKRIKRELDKGGLMK